MSGLVRRRGGKDSDDERDRANRVPPYGDVVEILQKVHAEGVDEPLCDEDSGVDPDGRFSGGNEGCVECRERRDERCTRKAVER